MEVVFTVVLISFAYQLTVNRRNKNEVKYLRNQVLDLSNQVLEANQHYEMILLYGKAKAEKREAEEAFKEEERLIKDQYDTGESAPQAAR